MLEREIRGLVSELGDDVGLPDDVELLPVHLKLVAPPLWHEHPVSNGHTHGDCFAWDGQSVIFGKRESKPDSFQEEAEPVVAFRAPGPAATTVASSGDFWAVSGIRRPPFVFVSATARCEDKCEVDFQRISIIYGPKNISFRFI